MRPLETKIVDHLLKLIRDRRIDPQVHSQQPETGGELSKAKRREAVFTDFKAVASLKKMLGLGEDSMENWQRLWRDNPALVHWEEEPPIGWVLEASGRVVGYLGSIPLLYQYGNRTLTAVTTHGLAVEPEYRAFTVSLLSAYFRQPMVDLYLNTTADPAPGKMAMALGAHPVAQKDYGIVLFWVLDARHFVKEAIQKLNLNGKWRRMGEYLAPIAMGADTFVHRRRPRGRGRNLTIAIVKISEIGEEFAALWQNKVSEEHRMIAFRTPEILRWHFEIPGGKWDNRVLACHKEGRLVGYIVIASEVFSNTGFKRSMIADLLVEKDDPEIMAQLLSAAYHHARELGNHVLEVLGFPRFVRNICRGWRPYSRSYPACPFYYKANEPALQIELGNEHAWYACPYDGDGTLVP